MPCPQPSLARPSRCPTANARTASTCPLPEPLYDAIGTPASLEGEHGIGKAEYVRKVLERHVYGALGYLKARVRES